jgi:hypothetical protein
MRQNHRRAAPPINPTKKLSLFEVPFNGTHRDSMFNFAKIRFTIERHGDKFTSFDQWKGAHPSD